ncbi:lipid A biosynthesis lauroyl acyltransferase [Gammaproteobacteria bacterium]|nr:lipid A biosynthesis lauroyl acyltransferase [Gammaproteobacteria bacterium]MDA9039529.1 lipid A biosynthesis lauroyl acyltransferase [Gammaproteobacteria bacterium]
MKALFYLISIPSSSSVRSLIKVYCLFGFYKRSSIFKVTIINIKIAYPLLNDKEQQDLAKESFIESLVSGFETFTSWSRQTHYAHENIFRITDQFLLTENISKNNGLIVAAIHSRSVDMLLKWINVKTNTTTLYKKVKNQKLDSFVRAQREANNNKVFEASISGVRQLFKALISNKVICLAPDQVPQDGMGEYVKLFNRDSYTTTLVPSLAVKTKKPVVFVSLNLNLNKKLEVNLINSNSDIYNDSKHQLSMNKDIEKLININAADYSWEYKRFKKPPTGISNPYLNI